MSNLPVPAENQPKPKINYSFMPIKTPCPECGGRMAAVHDFDVYVCENEHIISGVDMEIIQDREREKHGR